MDLAREGRYRKCNAPSPWKEAFKGCGFRVWRVRGLRLGFRFQGGRIVGFMDLGLGCRVTEGHRFGVCGLSMEIRCYEDFKEIHRLLGSGSPCSLPGLSFLSIRDR